MIEAVCPWSVRIGTAIFSNYSPNFLENRFMTQIGKLSPYSSRFPQAKSSNCQRVQKQADGAKRCTWITLYRVAKVQAMPSDSWSSQHREHHSRCWSPTCKQKLQRWASRWASKSPKFRVYRSSSAKKLQPSGGPQSRMSSLYANRPALSTL